MNWNNKKLSLKLRQFFLFHKPLFTIPPTNYSAIALYCILKPIKYVVTTQNTQPYFSQQNF